MAESPGFWSLSLPTYMENWPHALQRLSLASVDVPLTLKEAGELKSNMAEFAAARVGAAYQDISGIRTRVDEAVKKFAAGAFVRLGSRSPKDSYYGFQHGWICRSGDEAMAQLLDSERVFDDLTLAIRYDHPPHIFVREWVDLEPWQEFRCFMKDGKLEGISQYHYMSGVLATVVEYEQSIRWAIEQFFQEFSKASHLPSVVFDVLVNRRLRIIEGVPHNEWRVKLLEINPFFEMTDPCLFSWNGGGDFDGSFRLLRESGKERKAAP